MTGKQAIRYVINLEEPAFSERMMLRWLNLLEAEIQVKIHGVQRENIKQYGKDGLDEALLAPPPFDKIYPEYLLWRIRQAQGEQNRIKNQKEIYDKAWMAYAEHVCRTKERTT